MCKLRSTIREHFHFIVATTLLTLVMTFPTVLYLFRTDVMWLPIGSANDANHWDIWYWERILRGLEVRSYTNVIFYPEGVSLVHHPFLQQPAMVLRIFLQQFMPFTNAFNIVFLLVIFSNALAAIPLRLVAVKGQVGSRWFPRSYLAFSPHATNNPDQLHDATMASIALAVYFFHRGIVEKKSLLVVAAGLMVGLTSTVSPYSFACLMLTLAAVVIVFAVRRWRDLRFWRDIGLLALFTVMSSASSIYPMMADSEGLDRGLGIPCPRAKVRSGFRLCQSRKSAVWSTVECPARYACGCEDKFFQLHWNGPARPRLHRSVQWIDTAGYAALADAWLLDSSFCDWDQH